MQNKKFFCGFEPAKMHCEFMHTANAFQDESWDLSNFTCYERSLTTIKLLIMRADKVKKDLKKIYF